LRKAKIIAMLFGDEELDGRRLQVKKRELSDRPAQPTTRAEERENFFIFFACNSLKRLISEKKMKTNERTSAFIFFHFFAFPCREFAPGLSIQSGLDGRMDAASLIRGRPEAAQ
jgi:hypothetical protein